MERKGTLAKSKKDKGLHSRVVFLMTADQHAWLQARSESTGIPIAFTVRQAIQEYRERLEDRQRKASKKAADTTPLF